MSQNNNNTTSSQNSQSSNSGSQNKIEETQSRLTDSQMVFIKSIEDIYAHSQTPVPSAQSSQDSFWANSQTQRSSKNNLKRYSNNPNFKIK